jgi:hypothetical protein
VRQDKQQEKALHIYKEEYIRVLLIVEYDTSQALGR